MTFALTFVASDRPISAGHIAEFQKYLADAHVMMKHQPVWLAEHKAIDLYISDALDKAQMDRLHVLLEPDKIDVFCTDTKNRQKKLLCADMESTIIKNEMLEELAEQLGIKEQIAAITTRAMNGEINFETSLKERVALMKGLPERALIESVPTLIINKGARELVATMHNNSALCILISGGFTFYTGHIAGALGFDHHHANSFEIENGILTGRLVGDILGPSAKLDFLNAYCEKQGLDSHQVMAIGDGANDLPMLTAAGLGIGYHPKKILQETLLNQILHGDLSAALYAQGYKSEEIVSA